MTTVTYALPTASASILGGIKVGTGLSISSGILSATGVATTNASLLTSGTLADARLSANVPLLNAANTFTTSDTFSPTLSASSGTEYGLSINPTITQTGTAAYTALLVNATETTLGSQAHYLLQLQIAGSPVFNVDDAGNISTIGSMSATLLSGTLSDSRLSNNVPLLSSGNTFSALQTVAGSLTGPLLQVNNSSTIGAGIAIGSTTVASAGAGKIAPGLSIVQAPPATANYGLISIGSGAWDGSTTGKYVGSSASGTALAINLVSGYAGQIAEFQIAGVLKFAVLPTGTVQCSNFFKGAGLTDIANTGAFIQTTSTNMTSNARTATNIPFVCIGVASQTADLQQWQNSANAVQFGVTNRGSGGTPIWALKVRAVANAESMAQAHVIGAATGKAIEVMDDAGASLGWIALYA